MEEAFFKTNAGKYIYIFSDCQLVKGFSRTSICDTSRKRIFFITNAYYELTKHFRSNTIGQIAGMLDGENSRLQFYKFITFLSDENIATLVDDIDCFPEMDVYWDSPSTIVSAIIDVRHKFQYVSKSISELSYLQCNYLQIRIFEEADVETLQYICSLVKGKCFKDVEILVKFRKQDTSYGYLAAIARHQKNIRFVVHSVPQSFVSRLPPQIKFITQTIDSASHCGIINLYTLNIPSVQGLMENRLYNSCLNRKISVDENGYIRNCPSMQNHYGHISGTSLIDVVKEAVFRDIWAMNKDKILICKDCEFRYMCSDCRAYTKNGHKDGKPSTCSYNPYKAVWEA